MVDNACRFSGVVLALALCAAPTLAQQGNASDVSGANVTSSAIAGGFFTSPASTGPTSGSAGGLARAAFALSSALGSGTVSGGGVTVSGGGVAAVAGLVLGPSTTPAAARAQIFAALSASGASSGTINGLISPLAGLLMVPTIANVRAAADAFSGFVNDADASFLAHPPPEFQAIYAVLFDLLNATYSH
jgi:hypothetical protein